MPEIIGIETVMGDTVHKPLDLLYKPKIKSESKLNEVQSQSFYVEEAYSEIKSKSELIEIYRNIWNEYLDKCKAENTQIKSSTSTSKSFERFFKLGQKCLENYWESYHPFNSDRTLGVELEIEVDLNNDGNYIMVGILDRLSKIGNATYNIIDYKTYVRLPGTKKISEMSKQLEIYEFAIRDMYPDAKRINLIWYMLLHNEEVRITKNLDDPIDLEYLTRTKERVIKNIDEIKQLEESNEFEPRISKVCNWCEFKSICPAWKNKL